ncbi:MAG: hypothetical protein KC543_03540, partial [Myxococcales bacterium]|nr:hypothetical protein [Myxococcales bacterium]
SRAPNGLPPARRAAAPTPAEAAVAGSDAGSGASTAVDATTPTRRDRVRRFFRKGWPYMVAGALLAGVVTAVVVRRGDGGKGATPVLRFRPGPAPSP